MGPVVLGIPPRGDMPVPWLSMGVLDPGVAEALITLRGLLEEAVTRTGDPTPIGRRVAVVLLDGAVETAIATCLAQFNDAPRERDDLTALHSRLVDHLRAAGRLATMGGIESWPEVRRLRRARNAAQHHQIPPDHATMIAWSGTAQRFIESAVNLTFQLSLSDVLLAGAIDDPDLGAWFKEAETELARGRHLETVRALRRAFSAARQKWEVEQRDALQSHASTLQSLNPVSGPDPTLRRIEDQITVAPFVLDLGEYVWWQSIVRHLDLDPPPPISPDEARRAATFVFVWILRWQTFSARYTRNRLALRPKVVPPVSSRADGRPVFDLTRLQVELSRRDRRGAPAADVEFNVLIPFSAGHDEESGAEWVRRLRDAHAAAGERGDSLPWGWGWFADAGTVSLAIDPDQADARLIAETLESLIEEAGRIEVTVSAAVAADRQLLDHLLPPLSEALAGTKDASGDPAFTKVEVERRADHERAVSFVVRAVFAPPLHEVAIEAMNRGELPETAAGRLHPYCYEVPLTTPVGAVVAALQPAIRSLDERRRELDREASVLEARREVLESALRSELQGSPDSAETLQP